MSVQILDLANANLCIAEGELCGIAIGKQIILRQRRDPKDVDERGGTDGAVQASRAGSPHRRRADGVWLLRSQQSAPLSRGFPVLYYKLLSRYSLLSSGVASLAEINRILSLLSV